ncbi:GumC domain-containing protein [Parapedobacter koreensis]|uniref:Chain length determinant protein n=1 Tax=Parapedobacter koreensis TaxID=332977 RepID=A0A1H7RH48_9SPHI|nr:hypothetical protein [Parapedobacter koreensis]SEL59144.1 Chain length determinant protein [Parapedobacter koreensis]
MHENDQQKPTRDNDTNLKDIILAVGSYFQLMIRNWLVILLGLFVGSTAFLLYTIYGPTKYKAQIYFVVDEDRGGGMGLGAASGILSQLGLALGDLGSSGGFFQGDNIIEFLRSRSMIDKTLLSEVHLSGKTDLLINHYIRINDLSKKWAKNPRLNAFVFKDTVGIYLQDSLMAGFYDKINKRHLKISKKDKRLNIIGVTFESTDEAFAKAFAETLIQNASDFYIQTKTLRSTENLEVLTHQVDSVRAELNAAIEGVADATDANPSPNRAFQRLRVGSQKRTVDVQANTEILKELVKNQELAKITLRNEKPIIQILDRPILPLEDNKVGKVMAIIIGGFLGGFLTCLVLLIRRVYRQIMEADPS